MAEVEQQIDGDITASGDCRLDRQRIFTGGVLYGAPYQFRAVVGPVFLQVKAGVKRDFPRGGRVKPMAVAVINSS